MSDSESLSPPLEKRSHIMPFNIKVKQNTPGVVFAPQEYQGIKFRPFRILADKRSPVGVVDSDEKPAIPDFGELFGGSDKSLNVLSLTGRWECGKTSSIYHYGQHHRLFFLNAEHGLGNEFYIQAEKAFPRLFNAYDYVEGEKERSRVFFENLKLLARRLYTTLRVYDCINRDKDNQWIIDDLFETKQENIMEIWETLADRKALADAWDYVQSETGTGKITVALDNDGWFRSAVRDCYSALIFDEESPLYNSTSRYLPKWNLLQAFAYCLKDYPINLIITSDYDKLSEVCNHKFFSDFGTVTEPLDFLAKYIDLDPITPHLDDEIKQMLHDLKGRYWYATQVVRCLLGNRSDVEREVLVRINERIEEKRRALDIAVPEEKEAVLTFYRAVLLVTHELQTLVGCRAKDIKQSHSGVREVYQYLYDRMFTQDKEVTMTYFKEEPTNCMREVMHITQKGPSYFEAEIDEPLMLAALKKSGKDGMFPWKECQSLFWNMCSTFLGKSFWALLHISMLQMMSFNRSRLRDLPFLAFPKINLVPEHLLETVWNVTAIVGTDVWGKAKSWKTADFIAGNEAGVLLNPFIVAGPDGFVRLSDKVIVTMGLRCQERTVHPMTVVSVTKNTDPRLFFTKMDGSEYEGRYVYEREKTRNLDFELCLRLHIVMGKLPKNKKRLCPKVECEGSRYFVSVYIHAENLKQFYCRDTAGIVESHYL